MAEETALPLGFWSPLKEGCALVKCLPPNRLGLLFLTVGHRPPEGLVRPWNAASNLYLPCYHRRFEALTSRSPQQGMHVVLQAQKVAH